MDLALLLLRLVAGLLLAGHGAQKLFGWFGGTGLARTRAHLASLGFRPASMWAVIGAGSELTGGLLLALGLASPLGSIMAAAAMAVAITKMHWPKLWAQDHGYEYALVLFVVAVAVGIAGPGAYSLDAVLGTALPHAAAGALVLAAAVGYLVGMLTAQPACQASPAH
jgi:putative oxidoreductase